jgi:malate dehydrogenase (oxaloacetate-decarboxylating)(NADP+)
MITKDEALKYHSDGRKGKVEVVPTKPCDTQKELSLAYTPGVAEPCLEIEKDPKKSFEYTARGNLVAVVTNGTAVLGLGDIGPAAAKPVMEGKGVLFKKFADIDVFDIEIDAKDPAQVVSVVKALEPTFGGINLEDIKAPECFFIEEQLIDGLSRRPARDGGHHVGGADQRARGSGEEYKGHQGGLLGRRRGGHRLRQAHHGLGALPRPGDAGRPAGRRL